MSSWIGTKMELMTDLKRELEIQKVTALKKIACELEKIRKTLEEKK